MFVVESIHQEVSNWSLLQSSKSENSLKCYWPYFVSGLEYNLYNFAQHNLTTITKSHTNVLHARTNLMSAWIAFNMGMMHINPITTSTSQRYSRFVFVAITQFKSLFMWTIRVLYSTNTLFIRDNMEIHIAFTLWSNFKLLISSNLARLPCSRCLFGEE